MPPLLDIEKLRVLVKVNSTWEVVVEKTFCVLGRHLRRRCWKAHLPGDADVSVCTVAPSQC